MAKGPGRTKGREAEGRLTRARVIAAAVDLADQEGFERLSMRSLAARLGVEAMSLYNHVADRRDLIDGMADHVAGEIALPARDVPWKSGLHLTALSAHRALIRHPWAAPLVGRRLNVGPNMLALVEAELALLVAAGFSLELADHAMNAIDNHVRGFALQQLNFPIAPADYAKTAADYLPQLPPETYPHLRRLAERVGTGTYDGLNDVSFGINLILDGLERLLAACIASDPAR